MIICSSSNIDLIQGVSGYGTLSDGATDWRIENTASGVFNILNSPNLLAPNLSIIDSGNVGIGTIPNTGTNKLQVQGNANVLGDTLSKTYIATNTTSGTNDILTMRYDTTNGLRFQQTLVASNDVRYDVIQKTNNVDSTTPVMSFYRNNVGIGTTNPNAELQITNSTTATNPDTPGTIISLYVHNPTNSASQNSVIYNRIGGTSAGKVIYAFNVLSSYGCSLVINGNDTTNRLLRFNNSSDATGTDLMVINNSNGNVSIGTTSTDTYKLNVNGSINATSVLVNGTAITASTSQWTTSGANIYYNTGKVSIDTTVADGIFQVGTGSRLRISNGINDYTIIGTNVIDDNTNTRFVLSGNTRGSFAGTIEYISTSTGHHRFFTTNEKTERLRISNNGNVGIGTIETDTYKLNIAGNTIITNSTTNDTSLTIQNSSSLTITSVPSVTTQNTGDYKYMEFTYTTETGGEGSGQTEYIITASTGGVVCDILVVGGGGSGGNDRGGGGGGGGVIYKNITLNGSYTIRVGKGGLGPTSGAGGGTGTRGINGINTSISGTNFTTITSIGGGGGGSCNSGSIRDGLSGGSGGGGSHYIGNGNGGTGTAGQGRNGGTGFESGAGGGGGGAVNVGVNATSTNAGNGGVGLSNTITGSTVIYGSGGGGGGTSPLNFGGEIKIPGTGGSSGAGNGGGVNANGTNATVYGCGGGGGGLSNNDITKGGDGASGVVIIRYTSSSSINFVRGTTTDTNHDYKIGNYGGEFKVISSVSSVDTDYIKITSSGAISNPTGTASWNTGSDRRIKENIERASYDKCYDNINRLELNRFSYIKGFNTVNKDNKQLGFIAQEVYEVFPKSISSQGYYSDTLNIPDLLSIDVSQINYTLYGAVKKLIEINNENEKRLKKLETILNITPSSTSNLIYETSTSNLIYETSTSNLYETSTSNLYETSTSNLYETSTSNLIFQNDNDNS
jgi:hypothetical protein